MNGEQGSSPRKSNAGGWVGLVLAVLVVIGFVAAHAARSVQVTTCTDTVVPSCTVQTVPVTTQGP
jgi:hypothetical protein